MLTTHLGSCHRRFKLEGACWDEELSLGACQCLCAVSCNRNKCFHIASERAYICSCIQISIHMQRTHSLEQLTLVLNIMATHLVWSAFYMHSAFCIKKCNTFTNLWALLGLSCSSLWTLGLGCHLVVTVPFKIIPTHFEGIIKS